MVSAFSVLAAHLTAPALGQTGEDHRGLQAATEALFEAYPAPVGEPWPARQGVEAESPVSYQCAGELVAERGVNFAGRHTMAVIGCGTECQAAHVLNPAPGDGFASVVAGHGVDFRADSALLIVNPPAELTYFGADPIPARLLPRCLLYVGGVFEALECQGFPG